MLSLRHDPPRVLRPGGVTLEMLAQAGIAAVAQLRHDAHTTTLQPAPGMLGPALCATRALDILAGFGRDFWRRMRIALGRGSALAR